MALHAVRRGASLLFGTDPKLRRMMQYWAGTVLLYTIFFGLMYDERVLLVGGGLSGLTRYAVCGLAAFYVLIRAGTRLGLSFQTLAALQGVFGITCNMWAYSIVGPLRGASLMVLIVVVVFCTFALRPRQTMLLAFSGLLGMGATMWWHQAHDPLHFPPTVEAVTFAVMAACSLSVTFLTGEMTRLRARLKAKQERLEHALERIRTLATTDELTALSNRRHMNEMLAHEEGRPPRALPTCVALIDIDFFKGINDRHGHAAGDAVLRGFAGAARAALREGDLLARWGGEEFLLMLPDTAVADAGALLDTIRARVAAMPLPGIDVQRRISFSAGLCARHGMEPFNDAINRADKALHAAKSGGRDRVVAA